MLSPTKLQELSLLNQIFTMDHGDFTTKKKKYYDNTEKCSSLFRIYHINTVVYQARSQGGCEECESTPHGPKVSKMVHNFGPKCPKSSTILDIFCESQFGMEYI